MEPSVAVDKAGKKLSKAKLLLLENLVEKVVVG
jgi:hypothetical protein